MVNFLHLLLLVYVHRDLRSRGFGQQLMNIILPWLEECYPTRPIWIAMWRNNFKAQKFYSYYGFNKVDEQNDHYLIMKRQTC
jgi:ribosomal protein S18 acetylase RimI-like enzyme